MAPTKFTIYADQSLKQGVPSNDPAPKSVVAPVEPPRENAEPKARYVPETLAPNQRFYFDERKIYPPSGEEYQFEEIGLMLYWKRRKDADDRRRIEEILRENEDLKHKLEALTHNLIEAQKIVEAQKVLDAQKTLEIQRLTEAMRLLEAQKVSQQANPGGLSPPSRAPKEEKNRLSVLPQSLQPTMGLDHETTMYASVNDIPSTIEFWRNTCAIDARPQDKMTIPIDQSQYMKDTRQFHDKFTVPIDQSQYIKDNVPTSTPNMRRHSNNNNDDENRRVLINRRMSRPSMGGSPTLKLSPITETSRDCNSKSSSSGSSAMTATPGTARKVLPLVLEPAIIDQEPVRPLDPNDPTTYAQLFDGLPEGPDRRPGYYRMERCMPRIRQGACFQAGEDDYLVDKEVSAEARMFTAQLLIDDSNDSTDLPIKTICLRVDQPANEWLHYVCNELHRRLVKQKTKPDIELSVMIANPAIMYTDGSILIDEYFRFITLQHFFEACKDSKKPFPKPVAAYITLELLQLVRQIHSCDIVHMNVQPKNVIITCCPTREDIESADERTSVVKLIGFDRAMDFRLLPVDFKFDAKLDDNVCCEILESKPWSFEVDWFGVLNCIHQLFFLEDMNVRQIDGRWSIDKQFKGCPTDIWSSLFDELLNITTQESCNAIIDKVSDELYAWTKANINFVLKEAVSLERVLEEHNKASNVSTRT